MKEKKLEALFSEILTTLYGSEVWKNNPHLKDTPKRLSKMYLREIFRKQNGYIDNEENFDFKLFEIERGLSNEDCLVNVDNLVVRAFCAHHLSPFVGSACVIYKPKRKILGLSKFQRILDNVCSEPTVQEELTRQYAQELYNVLEPLEVKVRMKCLHTCMISRGVKLENATTETEYVIRSDSLV